jgi:hypothetical protein
MKYSTDQFKKEKIPKVQNFKVKKKPSNLNASEKWIYMKQ